jgi:CHAT domain-containing protein
LAELETEYPDFYHLRYAVSIADPRAIQSRLPDRRTVLLEYFIADDTLYTFAIDKAGLRLTSRPWRADYESDIARMRQIPDPQRWLADPATETRDYLAASQRLHELLIAPAIGMNSYQRLVIVPHGILAYVPFAGLVAGVATDFRRADFLLRRYAIQYANSATLWAADPVVRKRRASLFLGMAPTFSPALAQAEGTGELNFRGELAPLRYSAQEIREASKYFPGEVFEGSAATERAFKTWAPRANILHLATHALVSDSLPMQSRLLFASATTDTTEDNALHAYELYNLQLPAELAVLSACNTGFGRLQAGEGVLSLAHAFRYAGCRGVVMSLWPAEDEGTARILADFYAQLAAGLSKDEALRQARLHYLDTADPSRAHPYYWTNLVALGDMAPLVATAGWSTGVGWWALLGGALLILGYGVARVYPFKESNRKNL